VATALAQGKITAADTDKWRTELKEDFAGKSVELANAKPVIKTTAITANLGRTRRRNGSRRHTRPTAPRTG
jgi:hypothetical protein